jgi:hypothetical protein
MGVGLPAGMAFKGAAWVPTAAVLEMNSQHCIMADLKKEYIRSCGWVQCWVSGSGCGTLSTLLSSANVETTWVGSGGNNRRNGGATNIIGDKVSLRWERRSWYRVQQALVDTINQTEEE